MIIMIDDEMKSQVHATGPHPPHRRRRRRRRPRQDRQDRQDRVYGTRYSSSRVFEGIEVPVGQMIVQHRLDEQQASRARKLKRDAAIGCDPGNSPGRIHHPANVAPATTLVIATTSSGFPARGLGDISPSPVQTEHVIHHAAPE